MDKRERDRLLRAYQCDYNRTVEENFARLFSERNDVRLFFINENEAFTDGRNIVVDPAEFNLFVQSDALTRTGRFLHWPDSILEDPWNALCIITRAQNIHECLHLLYSRFPMNASRSSHYKTRNERKTAALIGNIIEDAYIEAAGSSCYDNIGPYLRFGRMSSLLGAHEGDGTVERTLGNLLPGQGVQKLTPEEKDKLKKTEENLRKLMHVLNYAVTILLYPMVMPPAPREGEKEYMEKTRPLWEKGSQAPSPDERAGYEEKIFDILRPLIPDDRVQMDFRPLKDKLGGTKTHSEKQLSIGGKSSPGRTQSVTGRLFTRSRGRWRDEEQDASIMRREAERFQRGKREVMAEAGYHGRFLTLRAASVGASPRHKGIAIHENHFPIPRNFRRGYDNIRQKYQVSIRTYVNRFSQILRTRREEREEHQLFGSGITSRYLGDPKKRYWYRLREGEGTPDLSVLLLVDGSGSMEGEKTEAARASCVILHEVLKQLHIPHAIVEHRAEYTEPRIDVNILTDFNGPADEELNIMRIRAEGNSRDGLALAWAGHYIKTRTSNEMPVLLVISDGLPCHAFDAYVPHASIEDTRETVSRIQKRGTRVIAISLVDPEEEEGEREVTSQCMKAIYPNLVECTDLNRLTREIMEILRKLI